MTTNPFSTDDILVIKDNEWTWRGKPLTSEAKETLKEQAVLFQNSILWQVISSGTKWSAVKTLIEKGETAEDLRFAKLLGGVVDTYDALLEKIIKS